MDTMTNLDVAIKYFKANISGLNYGKFNEKQIQDQMNEQVREGEVIREFLHPNVIALHHLVNVPLTYVCLVFPLMDRTLEAEIYLEQPMKPERLKEIGKMILSGVKHVHERAFIHRDLKPENILIDSQGCVKISDFGLAIQFTEGQWFMDAYGTKPYMAPEIFLKFGYNQSVDLWVRNYHMIHFLSIKHVH